LQVVPAVNVKDLNRREIAERTRADERVEQLNEFRLEALLQLNQMTEASLQEITDFAFEEGVRLTNSKIGYLAFMNDDETVLTMHSWSKTAVQEVPPLLAALRDAVADGDVSALLHNAHSLKGLMRYFGENPAANHAFELEVMGRDGDVSRAEEALAALEAEMEQFTSTLLDYMRANDMIDES